MSPYVNGLTFAAAVEVAGKALMLLRRNGVEPSSGHVLQGSVTFVVAVVNFDKLAARGELDHIKLGRAAPTEEISHHATIIHNAVLASLPDVRVMSVVIEPLATARQDPEPQLQDGDPPTHHPGTPASEQALVEAWGPFDADKKVTADPDTWPVPFGS